MEIYHTCTLIVARVCVCIYVEKKSNSLICNHNNFDPIFFGQKKTERNKFEFEIKVVRIFLDLKCFKEANIQPNQCTMIEGKTKRKCQRKIRYFFFCCF